MPNADHPHYVGTLKRLRRGAARHRATLAQLRSLTIAARLSQGQSDGDLVVTIVGRGASTDTSAAAPPSIGSVALVAQ